MALSKNDLVGRCKECKHHSSECDRIALEYAKKKIANPKTKGTSLCWCCKKAVPKRNSLGEIEGCSWSMYFQPIPGWDATPGRFKHEDGKDVITYCVNSCPEFERG